MSIRLKISSSLLFFILFFLSFYPLFIYAAPPSSDIALDSWVYPELEKLSGLGLIDTALLGTRPYTRDEAARQVAEARRHLNPSSYRVAREILTRLEEDFAVELSARAGQKYSYWKPLRNPKIESVYREGESITYPGTSAVQFPLNTNNFGLDYPEGSHVQLSFQSDARLGRYFLISAHPLALIDDEEATLRLLSGKIALGLGPLEISLGRQALWWGQGRHGSLVLTNNAKPLDMLRITNPKPQLLPWIFHYLGPVRFDVFWSELDNYIANSATGRGDDPYIGGLRFNFKPLPWLEFGASRTVIFGGKDIDINTTDFLTILGGENLEGSEDTSNSLGAIDARLKLPFMWDAELYGELAGEDQADFLGFIPFFSKKSWLAGLYLPRIEPSGRLSIRFEHADLRTIGSDRNVLYQHSLYTSGYTYENKILGHQAGPAAIDTYGELEIRLPKHINLALFLNYLKRDYDQSTEEKHFRPGLQAGWALAKNLSVDFYYAMDKVENFRFQEGEKRDLHFASLAINGSW